MRFVFLARILVLPFFLLLLPVFFSVYSSRSRKKVEWTIFNVLASGAASLYAISKEVWLSFFPLLRVFIAFFVFHPPVICLRMVSNLHFRFPPLSIFCLSYIFHFHSLLHALFPFPLPCTQVFEISFMRTKNRTPFNDVNKQKSILDDRIHYSH